MKVSMCLMLMCFVFYIDIRRRTKNALSHKNFRPATRVKPDSKRGLFTFNLIQQRTTDMGCLRDGDINSFGHLYYERNLCISNFWKVKIAQKAHCTPLKPV